MGQSIALTLKKKYNFWQIRLGNISLESYPKEIEIHAYFSIIYKGGTLETILIVNNRGPEINSGPSIWKATR